MSNTGLRKARELLDVQKARYRMMLLKINMQCLIQHWQHWDSPSPPPPPPPPLLGQFLPPSAQLIFSLPEKVIFLQLYITLLVMGELLRLHSYTLFIALVFQ